MTLVPGDGKRLLVPLRDLTYRRRQGFLQRFPLPARFPCVSFHSSTRSKARADIHPLLSLTRAHFEGHVGWFQRIAVTRIAQCQLWSGLVSVPGPRRAFCTCPPRTCGGGTTRLATAWWRAATPRYPGVWRCGLLKAGGVIENEHSTDAEHLATQAPHSHN
jgi:hypothetical protein